MRRFAVPPRVAVPGAVLLALALVFVTAWATRPGPARGGVQGSQRVAVTSITRSCPPAAPGEAAPKISMIALPGGSSGNAGSKAAAAPAGTATFRGILAAPPAGDKSAGGKGSSAVGKPVTVTAPGKAATFAAPGGGGAMVAATGKMAEGFEAEQTDALGAGVVSCTHPGSDMWFVGTGQADGAAQVRLYLMNTGNISASADVTIVTDTGPQNALTNAITVNPDQFVSVNVTPYVGGSQAVALHVQAATGQVAAAVWEGGAGGGAWLPQASAPGTNLVIPGLTVAGSAAKLFVVVPGAVDAKLHVVAYTPAGASDQFPGAPVDATAGAATPLDLNSLGASAAGLKLTSNVPIVAGVLVPGAGIGSFTTAVPPVTQQGVVAASPAVRGVTVGLLLTAPSATVRASVSVISAGGTIITPAGDQNVTVSAKHTLAVPIPRPQGRKPFAIVVTPKPGSGPLYAVRVVTSGAGGLSAPLSSLLPVSSAKISIILPPARNSYTAVLP